MKKAFLSALLTLSFTSLWAQFYGTGTAVLTEASSIPAEIDSTEMASDDILIAIDSLIRAYYSISPPVRNIHVNSSYGIRQDPFSGATSQHSGLDLRARHDTVYSMTEAVVTAVARDSRSGLYVTLKSGDVTISYCHLSRVCVRRGDCVTAGQAVGITGSTGRSTGEHLHITCRKNGALTDPTVYITDILQTREIIVGQIKTLAGF